MEHSEQFQVLKSMVVGEVSKNWRDGQSVSVDSRTVGMMFEEMIRFNAARGYRLHSWRFDRTVTGPVDMNETIVAVFERV